MAIKNAPFMVDVPTYPPAIVRGFPIAMFDDTYVGCVYPLIFHQYFSLHPMNIPFHSYYPPVN